MKLSIDWLLLPPKHMYTYFDDCFAFASLQVELWGGSGHSDQSASEGSGVRLASAAGADPWAELTVCVPPEGSGLIISSGLSVSDGIEASRLCVLSEWIGCNSCGPASEAQSPQEPRV